VARLTLRIKTKTLLPFRDSHRDWT